jgi:hypothetical protein
LLPGIDDGARTFEDSLTKATKFWNNTNHYYSYYKHVWDNTLEEIQILERDTTAKLATANISIPFKSSGEYLMDDQFSIFFPDE